MTSSMAPLRTALTYVDRTVPILHAKTYEMLGVRSFGKGAFAAPALDGDSTAYRTLRRVAAFDVVYPKLMAWEGAFAVVPEALAGRWVSPEFCLFEVDGAIADRGYLAHLLSWEGFRAQLAGHSAGTNARRRRLQPEVFLDHQVPLPHLIEQRRSAAHLDRVLSLSIHAQQAGAVVRALERSWKDRILANASADVRAIGSIMSPAQGPVDILPHMTYKTLGVMNHGRGVFARRPILGSETKYARYNQVKARQLIYSKLFAWEGSVAVVPAEHDGYFVSAEFPTFDLDPSLVLASYIHHLVTSPSFTKQLAAATTGMGQRRQRVNISDFEAIMIPLPDLHEQQRIVDQFDKLAGAVDLVERRGTVAAAMLPAARNEVFSALR